MFFCVGEQVKKHPEIVRDILSAGHLLGSHTYSHPSLIKVSRDHGFNEYRQGRESVEDVTGDRCMLFRPPHGHLPMGLARRIWRDGSKIVLWTFSCRDFTELPVETLWRVRGDVG